jgi:hypothetical protein
MNLVTAAQMLVLLEQTQQDGPEDDAYFIIHRLLRAELRRGNDPTVLQGAYQEFGKPTEAEMNRWFVGDKVNAIRSYRERTGAGLYHSKKAIEAAAYKHVQEVLQASNQPSGVTSCG